MNNNELKESALYKLSNKRELSYLERNQSWLVPLLISLIFLSLPVLNVALDIGALVSHNISYFGACLGLLVTGFKLVICNTLSARIILKLMVLIIIAFLICWLFYLNK